jgi:hypothetical protein
MRVMDGVLKVVQAKVFSFGRILRGHQITTS